MSFDSSIRFRVLQALYYFDGCDEVCNLQNSSWHQAVSFQHYVQLVARKARRYFNSGYNQHKI